MDAEQRQAIVDDTHLRLIPVLYWLSGGLLGLYALFIGAYFALIGGMFFTVPFGPGESPSTEVGWLWIAMTVFTLVIVGGLAVLKIMAGFWVRDRTHRVGTMVAAALSCLEIPYGTAIGVFTLVVLARPSVAALYEGIAAPSAQES